MTQTTSHELVLTPSPSTPWTVAFRDGGRDQLDLLGGKGANLCEMTRLGLPVPPGFVVTTDLSRSFQRDGAIPVSVLSEVRTAVGAIEAELGLRLGDPDSPLLLSVRSGARFSMPGMMETVLDVGLNDATVIGLGRRHGERFAWDCYARLVTMYGRTVLDEPDPAMTAAVTEVCERHGAAHRENLDVAGLRDLVTTLRASLVRTTGHDVPQDASAQLGAAIEAVLRSWESPRARLYRRREGIDDSIGTAVTVMGMVYGNAGPESGSGVCFTRDPSTGDPVPYGNYLPDAQGEDVVNGSRDALGLDALAELLPSVHVDLLGHLRTLEQHWRDLCDVEFTVECGRLWLLQTRVGKRTPGAAFRIAVDLVHEGVLGMDEALVRVSGDQLDQLLRPSFDEGAELDVLAQGLPVSAGAAVGEIALDTATAVLRAGQGADVVLVRTETSPDDLAGMLAARAVVTSRGGVTSHAAVVARGLGLTCVVSSGLVVDEVHREVIAADGSRLAEGEVVSVDGGTGQVLRGGLELHDSPVAAAIDREAAPSDPAVVTAVRELLAHADSLRRLRVLANADTPEEAATARTVGAQGIGLCRTEHMLLGERRRIVQDIVLDDGRPAALEQLEQMQREDLTSILRAMDGLPVVVRLLDPPLHEFLPDLVDTAVRQARAEATGTSTPELERLLAALRRWSERNPMLGLRGVRLGIVLPVVFQAQVRALAHAVLDLRALGHHPEPRLLVPLVADVAELLAVRALVDECVDQVAEARGVEPPRIPLGTMIEVPRAALTAGDLARACDFFSFGTNDLTQTTWGLSRDDAETSILPAYRESRVLADDPFVTVAQVGVGRLMAMAVAEGRAANPDLGLNVCGEHGGDPRSVRWFHHLGVDDVSCSPPRVRSARLEAGRAVALGRESESESR
jgi:pyruvate,orthophosphate dikinase